MARTSTRLRVRWRNDGQRAPARIHRHLHHPRPVHRTTAIESEDSEDSTPKPGLDRSDEWDMLPPPRDRRGAGGLRQVPAGPEDRRRGNGRGLAGGRPRARSQVRAQAGQARDRPQREGMEAVPPRGPAHGQARPSQRRGRPRLQTSPLDGLHRDGVRPRQEPGQVSSRSARASRFPWIGSCRLLDQLCAVLQEAHGHVDEKSGKPTPIIHRDLKPSNIMLVDRKPPGQDLKVLDFGIAKMLEEDGGPDATLTGAGDFLGTPGLHEPGADPRRLGQGRPARGGWPERPVLGRRAALPVDHRQAAVPGAGLREP